MDIPVIPPIEIEQQVENLYLGARLYLLRDDEIAPRIRRLIDETPARQRQAVIDLLAQDKRTQVRLAATEYEWQAVRDEE